MRVAVWLVAIATLLVLSVSSKAAGCQEGEGCYDGWVAAHDVGVASSFFTLADGGDAKPFELKAGDRLVARTHVNVRAAAADWANVDFVLDPGQIVQVSQTKVMDTKFGIKQVWIRFGSEARVIWQRPFSRVEIGYDPDNGKWIKEVYYVRAMLLDQAEAIRPGAISGCASTEGMKLTQELFDEISVIEYVAFAAGDTPGHLDDDFFRQDITRLETAFSKAASNLQADLPSCLGPEIKKENVILAVSRRYCVEGDQGCLKSDPLNPLVHGRLADWTGTKRNTFDPISYNDIMVVPADSQQQLRLSKWNAYKFRNPRLWREPPSPEMQLRQFEAAIPLWRAMPKFEGLDHSVFNAVGLDDAAVMRLSDIAEDLKGSIRRVHKSADIRKAPVSLAQTSDEVARTRVRECASFRGLGTFSGAQLSECTGYQMSEEAFVSCVSGGKCLPDIAAQSRVDVALLARPLSNGELGVASLMPRTSLKMPSLVDGYNECIRMPEGGERDDCLFNRVVKGGANLPPGMEAAAVCLAGAKTEDKKVECLRANAGDVGTFAKYADACKDARDRAACVLEKGVTGAMPAGITETYECLKRARGQRGPMAACVGNVFPDQVARLAKCTADRDRTKAADQMLIALCVAGGEAPSPEIQSAHKAAACYAENGDDLPAAAGCWAISELKLDGDLGKVANCVAQSGGSYSSTAVCLTGLDINAEGRIMLQCAESTGGEPISAATCVSGQLAMKELVNCKGKKFGEGACFGDGNAFQIAAKAVLGSTISSDSVVGQIASAHLDAISLQVETASQVARDGGKLLSDVGNLSRDGLEKIGGSTADLINKAGEGIGKITTPILNVGTDLVQRGFDGAVNVGKQVVNCCDIRL